MAIEFEFTYALSPYRQRPGHKKFVDQSFSCRSDITNDRKSEAAAGFQIDTLMKWHLASHTACMFKPNLCFRPQKNFAESTLASVHDD